LSDAFAVERRAAAESALVHARPDLAAFAVSGADRLAWLNGLLTQDVGKLPAGAGAYGLAVTKVGRVLAEVWVISAADRAFVIVARERVEALRQHFEKHLVMEDAEVGPMEPRAVVFAHGPRALELVDEARALSPAADAAMIDWTGRRNAAVILAADESGAATVSALLAKGAVRASDEGFDALRIAWGVPRFGVDYDDETLPQEASMERLAVSFTKGCYLGQETVFRLEKRGHPRRRLAHLRVEGDEPLAAGAEITAPDGPVGTLSSAASAGDGTGLFAIGSIKHKLAVAGTVLAVAGRVATVLGPAGEKAPRA
jgi:hypothetical protein